MLQQIQPVRGTRDITGKVLKSYQKIFQLGLKWAQLCNYEYIMLPEFEYSDIFTRTLGGGSDIISKETYTFSDRDKRMLTLRPEFTASTVRFLISNGMTQQLPQRLFTYGTLFRHERPQLGRYRQFYQLNYEYFGSASPSADVEVIALAMSIIKELGIDDVITLEINTLGDAESIERYKVALIEYFERHKNNLSESSCRQLNTNPLRILDSKDEGDKELIENTPNIMEYLNDISWDHHSQVCEKLDNLNIKYVINSKLVRGLDYYTHTIFEITTNALGSQNAIGAGGRYDGLVKTMGGPLIPAVGHALGVDRLYELMKKRYLIDDTVEQKVCYIIPIGEVAAANAMPLADKLRSNGIITTVDYDISTKKRMKLANKKSAAVCLIFGDDELMREEYIIRDMRNSKEITMHSDVIGEVLMNMLK